MTIVYCIFSLTPPGGMQRSVTVKANYLAGIPGYTVHVVTRAAHSGKPHFELSPAVIVHPTGKDYRRELTGLLYAIRPDIVISLYGEESRFLYKIGDGSKKILEFHFTRHHLSHLVKGLPNIRFRGLRLLYVKILQYLDERCARHYDRLVLLTEGDRLLWGKPANAIVIPNPLSFTMAGQSDLSAKRILSAGRLIATKGFDLLIDAFHWVAERHPDWKLSIIGEGQDKEFLLRKIRSYDLENQVEIIPPTANLAGEMLSSAIYASASRYEGFGLVITEAMECGVPTVAFDCECGPREIISQGLDGLLVQAFHTKEFAASLLRLIESPALRHSLGANARLAAGRYAPHKIMLRWEKLFESLLPPKTPAHVR